MNVKIHFDYQALEMKVTYIRVSFVSVSSPSKYRFICYVHRQRVTALRAIHGTL